MTGAKARVLLINKPPGPSSHQIVARLRKKLKIRKIGHAGTLDPFAQGLLVLGVGSATRLLTFMFGLDKRYLAVVELGRQTDTDDNTGRTIFSAPPKKLGSLSPEKISSGLRRLAGKQNQIPSRYSAIKIRGKPAYSRARAGEAFEMDSREIEFYDLQLLEVNNHQLKISVHCSSGAYIRALARDIGKEMGVGGLLIYLKRISVGGFDLREAANLEGIKEDSGLNPAEAAARLFKPVYLSSEQALALRQGKKLLEFESLGLAAAIRKPGELVAIIDGPRSRTVFPEETENPSGPQKSQSPD